MAMEGNEDWDLIPDSAPVKFDSAEHADIPSQCKLRLTPDGSNPLNGNDLKATLWPLNFKPVNYRTGNESEKRIPLTLAKVIAYAGDFYTSEPFSKPIAYGKTAEERQRRIRHGVKTLMWDTPYTLPKLDMNYMEPEVGMINRLMGENPDEALKNAMTEAELQGLGTHQILGNYKGEIGGYMPIASQFTMIGTGRYGDILTYNMDHFGDYAWAAYKAGHSEALRIAKEGIDIEKHGDLTDLRDYYGKVLPDKNLFKDKSGKAVTLSREDNLRLAYFYDAFALHYLSDQFASGHTRCPRMELNKPSWLTGALSVENKIAGWFKFNKLKPCRGGWDGMTNFLHDIDGATGLRVRNKRGDEWIAYGDAQYFLEPNRINRLKSIECCQRSINEVYETWKSGQYPSKCLKDGRLDLDSANFDALELVPIPGKPLLEEQTESNGNPSILWIVKRDDGQYTAQEIAEDPSKAGSSKDKTNQVLATGEKLDKEPDKPGAGASKEPKPTEGTVRPPPAKAPIGTGIDGERTTSENGFFFARRKNIENCSVTRYQWGSPGFSVLLVSSDVAEVERSAFVSDKQPAETRSLEILSGGFIQVQEYDAQDGKVNYGVNVWGPVQVPIEFDAYPLDPKAAKAGTKQPTKPAVTTDPIKEVPPNRQMTFTWRGRRTALYKTPEPVADNKVLRWHSWFDPVNKQKTSLLKFSFSEKGPTNAIVVESWAIYDKSAKSKPNQQWIQYENMTPANRLDYGGLESSGASVNDIQKTVLVSCFSSTDWKNVAHATRFFITPFLNGKTASNPDIITFTWKVTDPKDPSKGAQPIISVVETDNMLVNPRERIPPKIQTLAPMKLDGSTPFRGFTKLFEDASNRPMILHARATNKDPDVHKGIQIVPQVYQQDGSKNEIKSSSDKLFMPTYARPTHDDFYAVLVGDTRLCGHKELVVLAGTHPYWYLSAWEFNPEKPEKQWIPTSGPNEVAMKVRPKTGGELSSLRSPKLLMCALMPNEETDNGLNVVLVSSYETNNTKINIRVFIKDGPAVPPGEKKTPEETQPKPSAEATDGTSNPAGASETPGSTIVPSWVMTNWDGGFTTMVPSWVFDPSAGATKQPVAGTSQNIQIGQTSFGRYDQYGSILSTIGDGDRAYFASQPVPPPGNRPIDMCIVGGAGLQSGRVVPLPTPYKSVPIDPESEAAPSNYLPSSPLTTYNRYQAIAKGVRSSQPSGTLKFGDADFGRDPSKYILHSDLGGQIQARQLSTDGWGYGSDVVVIGQDYIKEAGLETEYYYDTDTKKPYAVMYKRTAYDRFRILNPVVFFQTAARVITRTRAFQTPIPAPLPINPPINKISTLYEKPKPKDRPSAGWKDFIDCAVDDTLGKNPHFHMLGWRMCKVASSVRGIPMWGIMNIFSFHGIIGCRVWAPREPGEYSRWICRGMNPYMGQTSLGTGYNSTGKWNDNVASLSWGPTEDFADLNVWNEKTASWSEVPDLSKVAYARGFEVKDPHEPKTTYYEATDLIENIPVVSAIPGLVTGAVGGIGGLIGSAVGSVFGASYEKVGRTAATSVGS